MLIFGLTGLRYDNWKFVFLEQRAPGRLLIWANPFTNLRVPKIFNLGVTTRREKAEISARPPVQTEPQLNRRSQAENQR
jgi:hypothetical protein